MLLGAVGIVLLIACTNIVNLLLARASFRSREFAERTALGAGRLRIMRQLLTESLLLTGAGGGLGVLLAGWSLSSLASFGGLELPRLHEANLDPSVLGFSLALTMGTAAIFSLVHMLHASRTNVNEALKEGGQGSLAIPRRDRARNLLVGAQVALSLVLLIGAGLFLRSLDRVNQVDAGFNPERLLTARLRPTNGLAVRCDPNFKNTTLLPSHGQPRKRSSWFRDSKATRHSRSHFCLISI